MAERSRRTATGDELPDFQWFQFYFPEIVDALTRFKTEAYPEHTETDPHDPVIALLRLFGLVAHQQAARGDHIAREGFLPTLRLRSSMIARTALIDYQLSPPVPAVADVMADLTGTTAPGARLVKAHSRFSTEGSPELPAIEFEYDEDDPLLATEGTGAWIFLEVLQTGDDAFTVEEHSPPESAVALWGGSVVQDDGQIWFGNTELQFDRLTVNLDTIAPAGITGLRWEYHDDLRQLEPDDVVDLGGTIELTVTELVGNTVDSDGLEVTVTALRTGQVETLETTSAAGVQKITTTGTLGQTTVSTNPGDYLVQTDWPEVPGLVDGTIDTLGDALRLIGDVTFTLPEGENRRWGRKAVTDVASVTHDAYFLRLRPVVVVGGPLASPIFEAPTEASSTTYAVSVATIQGRRIEDRVGTTDAGSPNQAFTLSRGPFLSLVSAAVASETWTRVDNFLASTSFDRHFTLIEEPDGSIELKFGNGSNGKIPAPSSPVVATYRIGGAESGNLGPGTIIIDRSGNGRLTNVRNPRSATGWVVLEGDTDESLNITRVAAPASLRTRERGVTPEDIEVLAVGFRTADNRQIVERARAVEEGFGLKTVKLVCVGPGSVAPVQADLDELDEFFNGIQVGLQRVGGAILSNMRVTSVAFVPLTVDVTASVSVLADFASGAKERIEAALEAQLQPSAFRLILNVDGIWQESEDFLWDFDGEVSIAFLQAIMVTSIGGVTNSAITVPAADIALGDDELPVSGTLLISVVTV